MRFCGVCLDPPLVVTEYYSRGSVFHLLSKGRKAVESGSAAPRVRK